VRHSLKVYFTKTLGLVMSHRLLFILSVCLLPFLALYLWEQLPSGRDNYANALPIPRNQNSGSPTPTLDLHPHALYAPGTDPLYIAEMEARLHHEEDRHNFENHWTVSFTASNTGGSSAGDALVLTWSIVPDGTVIPGGSFGAGEPACNSNLIAVMNARYGEGNWQAELQEVFDEWSALTGNRYVLEPNDDGAAWPTSRGVLGSRGDIRISGCAIDGNSGILAYNFFPSTGDMKIDSTDSFFDLPQGALNSGFHYVISHEHGHGVGLGHVCPGNRTKLMEPIINFGFNTLQHDDIRGAQRGYGDDLELPTNPNDSAASATNAGTVNSGQTLNYSSLSIDDNSDQDWIQFTVAADRQVDVTLAPVGFTYEDGDQSQSTGQCQPGPTIDSKTIHNLNFEIRDSDGVTVLASGNTTPAGVNEMLNDIGLGGAGVKYIRVFPATATNDVQLYDLTVTVESVRISTIAVTPEAGRAGTIFTVQLTNYLPAATVAVSVNGQSLGNVTTDANGSATFGLNSTAANDGRYYVRASDGTYDKTAVFVVDADAPLVPASPTPIFPIPGGIGYGAIYLPLISINR
jgi:hypothetical protein